MKQIFRTLTLLFVLSLVSVSCNKQAPPPEEQASHDTIPARTNYTTPAKLGNTNLFIEIADDDKEREQGLSGREPLTEEQGMLFILADREIIRPNFWMKDMQFDLDLIWLRGGKVVEITSNVPAPKNNDDTLPTYAPSVDIDMVLEVNAGWAERHNIQPGNSLELQSVSQI